MCIPQICWQPALCMFYHRTFKVVANSNAYIRFNTGVLEEQATCPEAVIGLNAISDQFILSLFCHSA